MTLAQRIKDFYMRHERYAPLAFFLAGFLFDIVSLGRIDSLASLLQQAFYLIVIGTFIALELLEQAGSFTARGRFAKVWFYREPIVHFLLGSLLSVYMLFYFKSSSSLASLVFVLFLCGIMLVNEFKKFDERGTLVRMTLFSLCKISYFLFLVPVLFGFIGVLPFLVAIITSAVALLPLYLGVKRRLRNEAPLITRKRIVLPFMAIQAFFIFAYFTKLIPPVPLAVSYVGIYHDIQKQNGKYYLSYTRSWWRFWQHGDQTFYARPGDKIVCFARIFSPTRFKEQVQIRWLYKEPRRGWQPADAIPLEVLGGRDEGYRGYTVKSNYAPGDWRVQIETSDAREIGRIYFTIVAEPASNPPKPPHYDIH